MVEKKGQTKPKSTLGASLVSGPESIPCVNPNGRAAGPNTPMGWWEYTVSYGTSGSDRKVHVETKRH